MAPKIKKVTARAYDPSSILDKIIKWRADPPPEDILKRLDNATVKQLYAASLQFRAESAKLEAEHLQKAANLIR